MVSSIGSECRDLVCIRMVARPDGAARDPAAAARQAACCPVGAADGPRANDRRSSCTARNRAGRRAPGQERRRLDPRGRLYRFFMRATRNSHGIFTRGHPISWSGARRRRAMTDVLVAALGVGGLLLMAAYAALCERI